MKERLSDIEIKEVKIEYLQRLKKLQERRDLESAHEEADKILCSFLALLGHFDMVKEWEEIDKWYA